MANAIIPVTDTLVQDQTFDEDSLVNFTLPAEIFDFAPGIDLTVQLLRLETRESESGTSTEYVVIDWLSVAKNSDTGLWEVTGTPPEDFNGTLKLSIQASPGRAIANLFPEDLLFEHTFTLEIAAQNDDPESSALIEDISVAESDVFDFKVPDDAFLDVDGDILKFSAVMSDGSELPGWLEFNAETRTFSGTPPDVETDQTFDIRVVADDEQPGSTPAVQSFSLTVYADLIIDGDDTRNVLKGGAGNDELNGFGGNDFLDGGEGNDALYGGDGKDRLIGGSGNDLIYGGAGDDQIFGQEGIDYLFGDDGDDRIYGGEGNDVIGGGDGNDQIRGGEGDDFIVGHKGNDTIHGGIGDDALYGGEDNDQLHGEDGDDVLVGSVGNDQLNGGEGDDQLYGGNDDDRLNGGEGDDQLFGGSGNDRLVGGEGADILDGGEGFDLVDYSAATERTYVNLLHGNASGIDTLIDIEGAIGSQFDDRMIGDSADNKFVGRDGNDYLSGGAGNDLLIGCKGDDALEGDDGNDVLRGGKGNDFLEGGKGADVLNGGKGDDWADYVRSDQGVTVNLVTGKGSGGDAEGDRLISIERVYGSHHQDTLIGNSSANWLYGADGADTLMGGKGDDVLDGGAGNDVLEGGKGDDSLVGGEGDDIFVYAGRNLGHDQIEDFEAGSDIIQFLASSGLSSFAELQAAMSQDGDDTIIDLGNNSSITLHDIDMSDLDADDFAFV